jgi:hypothetical protein
MVEVSAIMSEWSEGRRGDSRRRARASGYQPKTNLMAALQQLNLAGKYVRGTGRR